MKEQGTNISGDWNRAEEVDEVADDSAQWVPGTVERLVGYGGMNKVQLSSGRAAGVD